MGAPTWPPAPNRSQRPGGAVAALALLVGGGWRRAGEPQREVDDHRRALADGALDLDRSLVILDDLQRHGEAETGALPFRLGGEEGLEDLVPVLRGDAHPGIADPRRDVPHVRGAPAS